MSKKANRRAARQAFPQAKTGAPGTKSTSGKSSAGKGKTGGARALRPPSWRRAAIQGAALAVLYFIVIQYLWKGTTKPNVWGSLLIAFIGFVAYSGIAYMVDRYTYNRKLRKLKGSEK